MNLKEYNTVNNILSDEKEHNIYKILHYMEEALFDDEAYFKAVYNDLIHVAQQEDIIKFYKFLEHNKEEENQIILDLEVAFKENIIDELTKNQTRDSNMRL